MASSRAKPLYLGFYGSGKTSVKNIKALLDGLLDGHDEATFLVPATKDHYNEGIADIVEYADSRNEDGDITITFEAVTDASTAKKENLKGIADDARVSTRAKNGVGSQIVTEIGSAIDKDGVDGRLIFLWPDNPSEDEVETFQAADEEDIACFNLCSALDNMVLEDDGDGDDDLPSDDEMDEMSLADLRALAKKRGLAPEKYERKRKPTIIAALRDDNAEVDDPPGNEAADEAADEGEDEKPARSSRSRASSADEGDEAQSEAMSGGSEHDSPLDSVPEHIKLPPATRDALRTAAGDFFEMLAITIANEARRPGQAGKPRADGTPAAPRKAAPAKSSRSRR